MNPANSDDEEDDEEDVNDIDIDDDDDEEDDDEVDGQVRYGGKRQIQKYSVRGGKLFLEIDGGLPTIDLKADGTFVAQAKEGNEAAEVEVKEGMDRLGRRLSHSGEALRVSNAKFKGSQIYEMYVRELGTGSRFAAFFDEGENAYFLYYNDVLLMVKQIEGILIKLSHLDKPDLSEFGELTARPASDEPSWIEAQRSRH